MTSLLARPDAASTATPPRQRPLVAVATLAGALAAGGPLLVLMAVGVTGWFLSDAGAHGAPRDGMRTGALAWLAGHGSGLTIDGVRVTLVPLGITLLCAWVTWRVAHRAGEMLSGHGPDADRLSDGERDLTVPMAVATFGAGYVIVAVVTASFAGSTSVELSMSSVVLWSLALIATVAAPALFVGSGRASVWLALLPPAVRASGAVAGRLLRAWLIVATLVWVVALVLSWDEAATVFSRLHMSVSEAVLYSLVSAALAPNATLFAGSWLAGPGFAVGGATVVSPSAVVLGPLPMFPLLAALPDEGEPPAAILAVVVVGPLLAAIVAYRVLRERHLTWESALLSGCGGGIAAGLAFAVLVALSGGAAGPGRMAYVGPVALDVLVHAVPAMGIGGLLGASVLMLMNRWRPLESEA